MFSLIQRHWRLFAALTVAGLALRLLFVLRWPVVEGDSLVYAQIARHVLNFHIFGLNALAAQHTVEPTMIRLPGYPLFVAAIFGIFGQANFRALMLVQTLFDLATCFLIAETARRISSDRAARIAFALAALCPFTANYVGTALTETTEIFCTAAAVLLAIIAFEERSLRWWAACGAATAGAILLRPDGGLVLISLLVVIGWASRKSSVVSRKTEESRKSQGASRKDNLWWYGRAAVVLTAVALAPLVPWTVRNWRVFHVFQPLVTVEATDPGEFVPRGWERWVKTWVVDYSTAEDLTFHVEGEPIDVYAVPRRAFDSQEEFLRVAQLFQQYNATLAMTPQLDAQFGELAAQRIHRHKLMYYIALPVARAAGLWLRPRIEMMRLDTHWWRFGDDPHDSGIAMLLGALNVILVAAAVMAAVRYRDLPQWSLLIVYPVARTLLLVKMAAIEDRYTLECFPMVLVLAAVYFERRRSASSEQ